MYTTDLESLKPTVAILDGVIGKLSRFPWTFELKSFHWETLWSQWTSFWPNYLGCYYYLHGHDAYHSIYIGFCPRLAQLVCSQPVGQGKPTLGHKWKPADNTSDLEP